MISTIVARRYARALYTVAKEGGKQEAYAKILESVIQLLKESPEIEEALLSPMLPPDVKHKVVEELIKAYEMDETMANFLKLLVERRRIGYLRVIAENFRTLWEEEQGLVRAIVCTAIPMPSDLEEKLKEVLKELTGKKVVLELRQDPDIIGGVVAHIGDMVLDGSIRSQLQGFKESIGRGELG